VSNLYRRSGLSRVGCSLLLSSSAPSLFHRCSLSSAIVIQFGNPSIVLTLVYYGVALCCVIASRTKRKIGQ
jgi:hypothetical protein